MLCAVQCYQLVRLGPLSHRQHLPEASLIIIAKAVFERTEYIPVFIFEFLQHLKKMATRLLRLGSAVRNNTNLVKVNITYLLL